MMMSRRKDVDVVALDDALIGLAKIDPRQSRVVELRFFAGLSLEQISEVLEIAPATVQRDWTAARAWLHRDRKSTRLNSSHSQISYAVFCLKKKTQPTSAVSYTSPN